jgi:hypothetical protein
MDRDWRRDRTGTGSLVGGERATPRPLPSLPAATLRPYLLDHITHPPRLKLKHIRLSRGS